MPLFRRPDDLQDSIFIVRFAYVLRRSIGHCPVLMIRGCSCSQFIEYSSAIGCFVLPGMMG